MPKPFVTVILPIRNEADRIGECLRAVVGQSYPAELTEILVADGMSEDETREVVAGWAGEHANIRLLDNPGRIVPTGMNAALRQARGEIIVRVDGHTIINPDYVEKCVAALARTGAWNVGGRMNAVGASAFGEAVALATSSTFGIGGGRFHLAEREEEVDTVYMGAWPAEVFKRVGLFDEELVRDQDDEFNYRLRGAGGRIVLCPEIKSEYQTRGNPSRLWRQYFEYGFWKVRVLQKHPRQMSTRQFVPPAFVAGLAGLALLGLLAPDWGWFFWLMAGAYGLANLTASAVAASRRGWKHFFRLPLVFAILHVGYGCGFLSGLARFWKRWGDKTGKLMAG